MIRFNLIASDNRPLWNAIHIYRYTDGLVDFILWALDLFKVDLSEAMHGDCEVDLTSVFHIDILKIGVCKPRWVRCRPVNASVGRHLDAGHIDRARPLRVLASKIRRNRSRLVTRFNCPIRIPRDA